MAPAATQPAGRGAETNEGGMQRVGEQKELGIWDGAGITLHSYGDTIENQTQ